MSENIIFLVLLHLLFCSITTVPAVGEECSLIEMCTVPLSIEKLSYIVTVNNMENSTVMFCPRSDDDSSFSQYVFAFQNEQDTLLQGNYCNSSSNTILSYVCNSEGNSLAFVNLTMIRNKIGIIPGIVFTPTNPVYNTAYISVHYAPTGVYPISDTTETLFPGNDTVPLQWRVYHPNPVPEVKLFHNGVFIANETWPVNDDKYSFLPDDTVCTATIAGERTTDYTLLVKNATSFSSEGNYTVTVGNHTASITLVLDPSLIIITTTTTIIPSISPTPVISSNVTPSQTVTTDGNDAIDYTIVISITVIGGVLVVIIILVILLAVYCIWRRRERTQQEETDRVVNNPAYRPTRLITTVPADIVNGEPVMTGNMNDLGNGNSGPTTITHNNPTNTNTTTNDNTLQSSSTTTQSDISHHELPNGNKPTTTSGNTSMTNIVHTEDNTTRSNGDTPHTGNEDTYGGTTNTPLATSTTSIITNKSTTDSARLQQNGSIQAKSIEVSPDFYKTIEKISVNLDIIAKNTTQSNEIQRDQLDLVRENNEILAVNLVEADDDIPMTTPLTQPAIVNPTDNNNNSSNTTAQHEPSTTVTLNDHKIETPCHDDADDDDVIGRGPFSNNESLCSITPQNSLAGSNEHIVVPDQDILDKPVFDESPEYDEFHFLVGKHITSEWQTFAGKVGLSVNDINIIRDDGRDPNFKFAHVLNVWEKMKKKDKPFTWRKVIKVLREMDHQRIAESVVVTLSEK